MTYWNYIKHEQKAKLNDAVDDEFEISEYKTYFKATKGSGSMLIRKVPELTCKKCGVSVDRSKYKIENIIDE